MKGVKLRLALLFAIVILPAFAGENKKAPVRIVSLSPALTETVVLLGGERTLVGRSSACDFPESVKKLPVMGAFGIPEVERIIRLNPSLVISNDLINPSAAGRFRSLGIEVVMRQCASAEDYRAWLAVLGKKLGRREAAANEWKRVSAILNRLGKASALIPGDKRKTAVWIVWDAPLMIAGAGSLPDYAMNRIGCRNAASGIKSEYFKASPEWLARVNPAVIVWPGLTPGKQAELAGRPPWNRLAAFRKGRLVSTVPEDLILRPGPRFFEGLLQLRETVYGATPPAEKRSAPR